MEYDFTIILKDGGHTSLNHWQELYGLELNSKQLGKHFAIGERAIHNDGTISELVIRVLDRYREIKGVPVSINSLDRTQAKQNQLTKDGFRTAKTSPHVVCMAADIDTVSNKDTLASVKLLRQAAKELGIKIRLGYELYMKDGNTFIHCDVCPEYYAEGKPYHTIKHPDAWELSISW